MKCTVFKKWSTTKKMESLPCWVRGRRSRKSKLISIHGRVKAASYKGQRWLIALWRFFISGTTEWIFWHLWACPSTSRKTKLIGASDPFPLSLHRKTPWWFVSSAYIPEHIVDFPETRNHHVLRNLPILQPIHLVESPKKYESIVNKLQKESKPGTSARRITRMPLHLLSTSTTRFEEQCLLLHNKIKFIQKVYPPIMMRGYLVLVMDMS